MDKNSIPEDWKNITDPILRIKAQKKAWSKANREKVLASTKRYYEANKEKRSAYHKNYYDSNQNKIIAYRKANKEKTKISNKKSKKVFF